MKFGKQFEFYKIPEWSEYYLDYNGIKTIIKFLDKRRYKKKQLKKLKTIKAKLRKFSANEDSNNSEDINTNSQDIITNTSFDGKFPLLETKSFFRANSFNMKTEKIMEAEDLSGYSSEEQLLRFGNIYKKKIAVINDFFTKKL